MKKRKKSGKAMYALQLNGLNNTSLRQVMSDLRNKCVGLERHECVEPFQHGNYCGKDESEL